MAISEMAATVMASVGAVSAIDVFVLAECFDLLEGLSWDFKGSIPSKISQVSVACARAALETGALASDWTEQTVYELAAALRAACS